MHVIRFLFSKGTWDVRNPQGRYALPHFVAVLLIVLGLVLAFSAGFWSGTKYGAAYFESHYNVAAEHIAIPAAGKPLPRVAHGEFASAGSIDIRHYPGVGDQGPEGSCAAWAEAWVDSFQYRETHLSTHPWIRFSPKCEYTQYRLAFSQGQDAGSWFDQDSEMIPTTGIARFKTVPYPPWDASIVTSVPQPCYNTGFRFPVSHTPIDGNTGGGPGLIDAIKQAIVNGHAVEFALPVTSPPTPGSYDGATQDGGLVWFNADTPNRGAHANVFLAWDDSIRFPDGSVGGLLSQNQWTQSYGLNGRVWISYATVERFIFGVETVNVG